MRDAAKAEIEQHGKASPRSVINVSSTSGTHGNAGQVNYATVSHCVRMCLLFCAKDILDVNLGPDVHVLVSFYVTAWQSQEHHQCFVHKRHSWQCGASQICNVELLCDSMMKQSSQLCSGNLMC